MHTLQPKHTKLNDKELKEILAKYNLSLSQLPKIKLGDPALQEGCQHGDVIKIERRDGDNVYKYYRVVA